MRASCTTSTLNSEGMDMGWGRRGMEGSVGVGSFLVVDSLLKSGLGHLAFFLDVFEVRRRELELFEASLDREF